MTGMRYAFAATVDVRSNSRISGRISEEVQMSTPSSSSSRISLVRRS
jgi:hypothetical protein